MVGGESEATIIVKGGGGEVKKSQNDSKSDYSSKVVGGEVEATIKVKGGCAKKSQNDYKLYYSEGDVQNDTKNSNSNEDSTCPIDVDVQPTNVVKNYLQSDLFKVILVAKTDSNGENCGQNLVEYKKPRSNLNCDF